jgi:preprotein translocase subunit SecF
MFSKIKEIYEKKYKFLIILTLIMMLGLFSIIGYHWYTTGDFVTRDISIRGGLLITVTTDKAYSPETLEASLKQALGADVSVKSLSSVYGGVVGYSFELPSELKDREDSVMSAIGKALGLELEKKDYTIEETSPTLGASFWKSTLKAILFAFILMSIVVYFSFRLAIPSGAVILCAIADVSGTVALMDIFGVKLSTAGVAALLMLIGYSVDSDILLSSRLLHRKEGTFNERLYSAFKTGIAMQLTTLAAVVAIYLFSPAESLKQIATVLMFGICLDIPYTWVQNASIMRWYLERKEKNVKA